MVETQWTFFMILKPIASLKWFKLEMGRSSTKYDRKFDLSKSIDKIVFEKFSYKIPCFTIIAARMKTEPSREQVRVTNTPLYPTFI